MAVLELVVPLLLVGSALLGLWRRVDVYDPSSPGPPTAWGSSSASSPPSSPF